jgi:gliding motility-associated-like protein
VFENLQAGLYTLVVTDAKGCKVVQQDSVDQLTCCEDIVLPNAFTPNEDQVNDVFKILNPDHIEVLRFVVANRWGNLVFKTTINDVWNGEIGGTDAAADTYYYFVQYRCKLDGKEYLKKGDVILVR